MSFSQFELKVDWGDPIWILGGGYSSEDDSNIFDVSRLAGAPETCYDPLSARKPPTIMHIHSTERFVKSRSVTGSQPEIIELFQKGGDLHKGPKGVTLYERSKNHRNFE